MDYVKSKLFQVPTIVLIQQIIFITILATGLFLLSTNSEIELLIYWAIVILATQLPTSFYFFIKVKKNFDVKLQSKIIIKYIISSITICSITHILIDKYLIFNENLFVFVPNLVPFLILNLGGYLVLTYLIDNNTKELFNAIIKEIKNKY